MAVANEFVTPQWTMKKVGKRVVNNIVFGANVNRSYDDQYKVAGAKVGDTVNARLPQRYLAGRGPVMTPQPIVDRTVPIQLTDQVHVGIEFTSASLTMYVDDYNERYIEPAVDQVIQEADGDGMERMYLETHHCVGVPGTTPGAGATSHYTTNITYLDAGAKLDDYAVPMTRRVGMLSPTMHTNLANVNAVIFNPANAITKQYREGQFGDEALGVKEWYKTQNVFRHLTGTPGGTPVVNGAGQTGTSISIRGMTATTGDFHNGDILQFAGSFGVNPMSRRSTGRLMDQLVQADATASGGGVAAVTVYPGIVLTGALQTVTASPADGATVTMFGQTASTVSGQTSPQGLIYDPDSYALVFADLEKFEGIWLSERISNKALGISIRMHKGADVVNDVSPARIDILYGWKKIRDFSCRVAASILLAVALTLSAAQPAEAQRILSTTTLSAAVTATATTITVDSATGVVAGRFLFVDWEVMRIISVDGTTVTVGRGALSRVTGQGSIATAHASGERVILSGNNSPGDFHDNDPNFGSVCVRGVGQAAVLPWVNISSGTIWSCPDISGDDIWRATNVMPVTYNSIPTSF